MVTDAMVEKAAIAMWCAGGGEDDTPEGWERGLDSAKDRYREEARAALRTVADPGPSREERLVKYRAAAMPAIMARFTEDDIPVIARLAESMAHAMLAAERPAPEASPVLDGLKDDMIAALEKRIELLYSGIRLALGGVTLVLADEPDEATDLRAVATTLRDLLPPTEETPTDG